MLQSVQREPLFGGYGLIAVVWVAGIGLRSQTSLVSLDRRVWLAVGVVAACVCIVAWLVGRRLLSPKAAVVVRGLLIAGLLICWLAFGAARMAFADVTSDPGAARERTQQIGGITWEQCVDDVAPAARRRVQSSSRSGIEAREPGAYVGERLVVVL